VGGWYAYRFSLPDAVSAQLAVKIGNRFLLSASSDGENWREVLRETKPASGLSNLAERKVDLTPFLGSRWLFVKFEHSMPQQPGFGPALFRVTLTYEEPDRGLPLGHAVWARTPPVIDGSLDDACWAAAQTLRPFARHTGRRSAAEQTQVRVCFNQEALFIGFECFDAHMESATSVTRQRDSDVFRDNAVEVFLHPHPGQQPSYYHLAANTLGTRFDELESGDPAGWNPEWRVAVRKFADRWVAEMAIPWQELGLAVPGAGEEWRANFCRVGGSQGETSAWSCTYGGFHRPERFGVLRFGAQPSPSLQCTCAADSIGPSKVDVAVESLAADGLVRAEVLPRDTGTPDLAEGTVTAASPTCRLAPRIWQYGSGDLAVALLDAAGNVLQRAAIPYEVKAPPAEALLVELRQPYWSEEPEAIAKVECNLPPQRLAKSEIRARIVAADGTAVAQALRPARRQLTIGLPISGLAAGDYQFVVELLGARGAALATEARRIHRLAAPPRLPAVSIGVNNVTYVQGRPVLPLIMYLVGAERAVRDAGYDVVVASGGPDDDTETLLNRAAELGLGVMMHLPQFLRGVNDFESIKATVSRFKNHPALFAWYAADEPEGYGDTPELQLRVKEMIHEIDPRHPVVVLNNTPAVFAAYAATCDVQMADPYPIPYASVRMVAEWTEALRRGVNDRHPVWMCLQTHNLGQYGLAKGRYPTPQELRCMAYLALIHGAKGIAWWAWGHAQESHFETYAQIARELRHLRPVLLAARPPLAAPEAVLGPLHTMKVSYSGALYVFAANDSDREAQLEVEVGGTATTAQVLFEKRRASVTGGVLKDRLAPLGVRVYRIHPGER
jgi:hypothetical protein